MKTMKALYLAVWLVAASPLAAQQTAAQIGGRITDQTGAVIADASVVVRNTETGIRTETTSNAVGNYVVPLLEPGSYQLQASKSGFRPITQSGIVLRVNQAARLDFTLELGTVSEAVSVTADAPLLEASQSSLGAVVDNSRIVELPLNGRNPFDLVFLAPGAQVYNRLPLPGNNIPLSHFSINGGPPLANEVLLDGIPNTSPQINQYVVVPSIDAVQEFKVQTNNMSAEFGRTTGGVINVSMRAGTNALHGTLYEFLRNNAFDANRFFNNATGQPRPVFRYNQFGASAGGPVRKDRTFFFGNYEGLRRRTSRTFLFTVPTNEQRTGDFSKMRGQNGQPILVYDPFTSRQLPSGAYLRDQFPANRIPADRVNPISRKMMSFWPAPNVAGHPVTQANNFISNAAETFAVDQVGGRIDHAFSHSNRLFGRVSWNSSLITPPNIYGNIANPGSGRQLFTQRNIALNDTHAFTPHTFATFRIGFARLRDSGQPFSLGYNPAEVGLPAYLVSMFPAPTFPPFQVSDYTVTNVGFGTGTLGPVVGALLNNVSNAYTAQSDVTIIRGAHVLKAGFEYRLFRLHGFRPNLPVFNFDRRFTQGPDPTRGSPNAGESVASFLLGTANGGSVNVLPTQDTQSYYSAAFFQDDYKLTRRLTVNLGARLEIESLRTDRYNRLNYLDLASPSPLQAPGVGQLRGGLKFMGVDGNPRQQARVNRFLSPRFGFAYQLNPATVVRGGYGIFVAPRTGWDFGRFGQTGYSATTSLVSSIDGITPNVTISHPYPNGFVTPTGNSLRMLTDVGTGLTGIDRDQKSIYVQQWNFNLQRTLPGNVVVEASYAGSKGTRLWQNLQFDQLPDRYLALANELIRRVPNPFFGIIPATQALGTPTIAYGQLLRPYPHFNGVTTTGSTSGSSIYHSFQMRVEKRLSRGLSALLAYTNGKLIDDGAPGRLASHGSVPNFQNHNNRKLERAVSSQEVSQRLSIAYTYQLPFGPGRGPLPVAGRIVRVLVAGWQINGIHTFQTGSPLALTTSANNTSSFGGGSRPNSSGKSAKLSGPVSERLNRYLDTSAFSLPAPYTFGNVSRTLPDVRSPGNMNFDFSLLKNVQPREWLRLQLRAEAFNAFNRANFGPPGLSVGARDFGVINSSAEARILQLGLKFIF